MCGICGFLGFEDKETLRNMMERLSHRGPDDSGTFLDDIISLGHVRLSIIDIKSGRQPIFNEDGSIVVIFNGEIYNYRELKVELEAKGHEFYTTSDTEVIVHLYEEEGSSFVHKLNGMFAIAIWDAEKKKLILVRDRIGIKPLYYTIIDGILVFGSEIKAILKYPGIKPKININVLNEFFSFGYVSGKNTLFSGIKKLEQGNMLIAENGEISIKRYWELDVSNQLNLSETYFVNMLRKKIKKSVEAHMLSDVPIGAFLSGGIDSSYIVGLMTQFSDEPVKTFSVGFDIEEYNELKYARKVADYFGTEHEEILMGPEIKLLKAVTWHMEEPATDPALVPFYKISDFARKKVKVVLTGDGADELFGGYNVHKIMYFNRLYYTYFPSYIGGRMLFRLLPDTIKLFRGLKFSTMYESPIQTYFNYLNNFKLKDKKELYNFDIREEIPNDIKFILKNANKENIIPKLMKIDCQRLLPNYFLMKVDKMTMGNSIEARVPFLDHNIIEFVSKIPSSLQIKYFKEKYILRKVAANLLPADILKRPKHGFDVPVKEWFDSGLIDIAKQLLDKKEIKHGLIKIENIDKILKNDNKRKAHQLWTLMMFQLWYKTFFM